MHRLLSVTDSPTESSESYTREEFLEGLPRKVFQLLPPNMDCGMENLVNKARIVH